MLPLKHPQLFLYQDFVSAKATANALVSIKIRMILIDYTVAEKVCLSNDDKALVSFGQFVLWKILLQTIFLNGQKKFAHKLKVHVDGDLLTFLTTQVSPLF